ncbi:hypothetical protein [Pseudomonas aeruginosa]|uniref:hypothetical protein n=1 Tax=Pseudomonas aeruginosa TaxID=287 RepID=UPI00290543AF|nr:hypothetical protein [Pseudomonas aeruginosa]MDU0679445.1 hypothetical protein [Pseudomonas aeruginosa]
MHVFTTQVLPADVRLVRLFSMVHVVRRVPISDQIGAAMGACIDQLCSTAHEDANVRISVNVTAHFANNVTGASTRLRGV